MLDNRPIVLSVDEACEVLRVGYNMMYHLLKTGKIKAVKCGRVWKIPRQSICDFLMENKQ